MVYLTIEQQKNILAKAAADLEDTCVYAQWLIEDNGYMCTHCYGKAPYKIHNNGEEVWKDFAPHMAFEAVVIFDHGTFRFKNVHTVKPAPKETVADIARIVSKF